MATLNIADDDSIALPSQTMKGEIWVDGDNERADFYVESSGAVTIDYGFNTVNTNTDGSLVIINRSGTAYIKNRLGSAKDIVFSVKYK